MLEKHKEVILAAASKQTGGITFTDKVWSITTEDDNEELAIPRMYSLSQ